MNAPVTRQAPGKLVLAGEYAVLTPGQLALVAAVDRYVTVTATPAHRADVELVTDLVDHPVELYRDCDGLRPRQQQHDAAFVSGALTHLVAVVEATDRLRAELGLRPVPVRLSVRSCLHQSGVKIGLGSSGAVTVAAVHALTDFAGPSLGAEMRFRLALLASLTLDVHASGADLAASTWGGWIRYSAPDRQALHHLMHLRGLLAALHAEWPGLSLNPLAPPSTVTLHPGWTGRPASTTAKVSHLQHTTWWHSAAHQRFCSHSSHLVEELTDALDRDDSLCVLAAIDAARELLLGLDEQAVLGIFTPELTTLCDMAKAAGGAGKPSGAGGGDCGIAFLTSATGPGDLHRHWRASGITPLRLAAAQSQLVSPPARIGPHPDSTLPTPAVPIPRTVP
ncbi:phosphomevalonate kinase [Streptomyces sp. NPDC059003]|uniref:phosphomevalonate kinase n=1 Tax=Streptomyces sp. NPDC059003 TaxID=3346691 RepID=UPI0036BF1742